ncbi:MAG: hypothetical protein JRF57_15960 [Deltaproteobacteria bacterium]|nr:hypothetical protein [Deltaproteobacteria bacterium]
MFKIKLERIIHEGHPIVGLADQYEQVEKENQGLKVIKKNRLKGVNIDTTVQEKFIRYPTDAKLYNRTRSRLVSMGKDCGICARATVVFPKNCHHAGQVCQSRAVEEGCRDTRKLRRWLGRVRKYIERKCTNSMWSVSARARHIRDTNLASRSKWQVQAKEAGLWEP